MVLTVLCYISFSRISRQKYCGIRLGLVEIVIIEPGAIDKSIALLYRIYLPSERRRKHSG